MSQDENGRMGLEACVREQTHNPPRLQDRFHAAMRRRNFSRRTEKAYWSWIKRFIAYHGVRPPSDLMRTDIEAFMNNLATTKKLSASTQNQAVAALTFLYREVLNESRPEFDDFVRAKRSEHIPVVLSRTEVQLVLQQLTGTHQLIASLLYGAGLRLMECLRLRVRDLDFDRHQVVVRRGKGAKDRSTLFPLTIRATL